MALFAWPLSRVPKWFRKGFNWHRLEVSGIVTFMFKKQASSFFFSVFRSSFPIPVFPPWYFFCILSHPVLWSTTVFLTENPSFFGKPLNFRVRKGRRRRNPILTTHRITCVETDKELWKSLTGIIILPPILRRNHEISTHFFVSFARHHSITQYFRIGYFIFPSPTVWVLVSYNEPCMARWFSGCFFEPMSLAWRATNWKRYDYSCWFQKSLVDFLPLKILGFNKYI